MTCAINYTTNLRKRYSTETDIYHRIGFFLNKNQYKEQKFLIIKYKAILLNIQQNI
ncbi:hypothetical protein [Flavobacterium aestuarii]|uniref:hypothetical protein n=1 Tax=Flavobacterium aestuarii TaxID=3149227 RepID=UPI0032B54D37